MKKLRLTLSLLLVACMVLGLIGISSAGSKQPGHYQENEVEVPTGGGALAGQTTYLDYDSIKNGDEVKVYFDIYLDAANLHSFNAANPSIFNPDPTVFVFKSAGSDNDYLGTSPVKMTPDGSKYNVTLSYPFAGYSEIGADNYCVSFYMVYGIADAAKLKAVDPSVGYEFRIDVNGDFNANATMPASGSPDGIFIDDKANAYPGYVTYVGDTVSYDINGGTLTADSVEVPAEKAAPKGGQYDIVPGIMATKEIDDVNNILYGWEAVINGKTVILPLDGSFTMPNHDVVLKGVYSPDEDNDGIADALEHKVTFALRDGDEAVLTFPEGATDNGTFFGVSATEGTICVEKENAIGNSYPQVAVSEPWVVVGFFVDGEKIDDIASYVPTGDVTIEIRTMPDENGNNIDDRENVTINFYDDEGELIATYEVPDGTPYTVYGDDTDSPRVAEEGNADEDPTEVDLTGLADPTNALNGPLTGWDVTPVYDDEGEITEIIVTPIYQDQVPTVIPGPVIDDRDDSGDDDDFQDDIEDNFPNGTIIIWNGIDGDEIDREVLDGTGLDENGVRNLKNPEPGSVPTLPVKDEDGNPFLGWKLSGPEQDEDGNDVYYMDPVYDEPVQFTANDPEDPENPVFDEPVPKGTEYAVEDETGDVVDEGTIDQDTVIDLPTLPEQNEDGEYFDHWDVIPEDFDGDEIPDKYTFVPVYELPDAEDIDIIPNEGEDGMDEATGYGLTILRGEYRDETTAEASFLVRIYDKPATEKDLPNMSAAVALSYGFEPFEGKYIFGSLGQVSYVGTKDVDGKTYGEFKVVYETVKSSIVTVSFTYGAKDEPVEGGHVVITVADCDKNSRVNSVDYGNIQKSMNEIDPMPEQGSTGAFVFELMDTDKSTRINSVDYGVIQRMMNGFEPTN